MFAEKFYDTRTAVSGKIFIYYKTRKSLQKKKRTYTTTIRLIAFILRMYVVATLFLCKSNEKYTLAYSCFL